MNVENTPGPATAPPGLRSGGVLARSPLLCGTRTTFPAVPSRRHLLRGVGRTDTSGSSWSLTVTPSARCPSRPLLIFPAHLMAARVIPPVAGPLEPLEPEHRIRADPHHVTDRLGNLSTTTRTRRSDSTTSSGSSSTSTTATRKPNPPDAACSTAPCPTASPSTMTSRRPSNRTNDRRDPHGQDQRTQRKNLAPRSHGARFERFRLGGAKGTRTPDPLTASEVRYQLRHSPVLLRVQLYRAENAGCTGGSPTGPNAASPGRTCRGRSRRRSRRGRRPCSSNRRSRRRDPAARYRPRAVRPPAAAPPAAVGTPPP